jgi:hypothetical protein
VTEKIYRAFHGVYRELGHGFLESVYQSAFVIAARDLGLRLEEQAPLGTLLNFGLNPEFKRVVLERARKTIRVNPRVSAVSSSEVL